MSKLPVPRATLWPVSDFTIARVGEHQVACVTQLAALSGGGHEAMAFLLGAE